ncbi:hypothetical protein [Streptomyces sp. NPDC056549]|uniref:hypothetical protein n=1 Tax=Streptomyces sp. NPDC056549 TaxID=3345864 RepID=UPI00368946A4
MGDEGLVSMTVKVVSGTRSRLETVVAHHRAVRLGLARDARWAVGGLNRRKADAVRARWRAEVVKLRAQGQLLDTVDSFVLHAVCHELGVREWSLEWSPAQGGMGRWPGARDGGYPEALSFRLPVKVARQVRVGCWSVSAEAVGALRDWRDRYPGVVTTRAGRDSEAVEALAEYERWANQVVTVGNFLRAALEWGLTRQDV